MTRAEARRGAPVAASAPGYVDSTEDIVLTKPMAVLVETSTPVSLTPLSAPAVLTVGLRADNGSSLLSLRGGAPPLSIPVSSTSPAVGSLNPSTIVFNGGDAQRTFEFRPLAEGSTLLTLGVPAGFTDPVAAGQRLITVIAPRVAASGPLRTGFNLARTVEFTVAQALAQPWAVTFTSTDPARLLLANAANPNGGAAVTVTFAANATRQPIQLIGLASTGTVALRATAQALNTSFDVTLGPAGFRFGFLSSPIQAGVNFSVGITPSLLNSATLAPEVDLALRPGMAAVAVGVTSSSPAVAVPQNAPLNFAAGGTQLPLTIRPIAAGNATLTIVQPAGFTQPSSNATLSITVP